MQLTQAQHRRLRLVFPIRTAVTFTAAGYGYYLGINAAGPEPAAGVAAVLARLDALAMAAEHTGGYARGMFRHWVNANGDGCDARREVLLAEAAVPPTQGSGCSLTEGEWTSHYDGLTEPGSAERTRAMAGPSRPTVLKACYSRSEIRHCAFYAAMRSSR